MENLQARKEELQGFIDSRKKQIEEGVSQANQGVIESEIAAFESEIAAIEEHEQNEAAAKVVIQEATTKAEYFLDNMEVEGLSMSQLSASEDAYKLQRMAVQNKFIEIQVQAANDLKLQELAHQEELRAASERELQLKRQNEELQRDNSILSQRVVNLNDTADELDTLVKTINNELTDALSKRDAAMAKVDGLELLVSEKQAQIDILRTENAVGAAKAPYVIDAEAQRAQMKELADKIKNSRIHVYDVVPDNDINPKNYTAKRADTGEVVTYNWTIANMYIELNDEDEVNRFRQQHDVSDLPLGIAVDVPTIPEVAEVAAPVEQFQAETAVQSGNQVDIGVPGENGQGAEKTIEEAFRRIEQLELTVYGQKAEVA